MLLNRDEAAAHATRIALAGGSAGEPLPSGPAQVVQYSPVRCGWLDKDEKSHPIKDEPPVRFALCAGPVMLPATR
jgi:hypothetical protein